ncbi:hypothetical protein OXX59_006597 [Metschnikowia pulcherrima]
MTRTKKWTVHEKASTPKYFTHNGHFNTDPNKISKNGNGKFNWGRPGDEFMDEEEYTGAGRRNSNHALNESNLAEKLEDCNSKLDLA